MKKTFSSAVIFLMLCMFFSTEGQARYKGKLTCKDIEPFLTNNNLSDGRVRSLCTETLNVCLATEALGKVPPGNSLRTEMEKKLMDYLDLHLGLCELGFLYFAPSFYHDNLAR